MTNKQPLLSNTAYDLIKDIVEIGFPAAVTLFAGLSAFWSWPNTEAIVGSAGLVGVFLGVILKISAKRYQNLPVEYDGQVITNDPNPMRETYRLELNGDLNTIADQKELRLEVIDLLPKEEPHLFDETGNSQ